MPLLATIASAIAGSAMRSLERRAPRAASLVARAAAPWAKPGPIRRGPGLGKVVSDLPVYQQVQRIGGNLTPQQVSGIIQQAETGYIWRFVDLANESRQKDCHLHSDLSTLELSVQALPWQVLPAKLPGAKKPKLRDRKAAEFVEQRMRELEDLPELLSHLAGGQYHGFSVAETMWKRDGRFVVPCGFDRIQHRRFVYDIQDGRLRWCDLNAGMQYPGIDLREKYPGDFIQYQPRVNGDAPVREGLARVLVWAALFRNWDQRDWLALAELAWKPWRLGLYKKGASQEDVDALVSILDGMASTGVAVYPETTEVKVEWPKNAVNGDSAHKVLFDTLGAEMSKAILGQTLTTEQGSRGSQALGKVHDGVRKDRLEGVARSIASTIRRDLITPMVRRNFGDTVLVPEFRFMTEDSADLVAFSTAVKNVVSVGLRVPAKHVRDVLGIPEPEGDEECLGGVEEPDEDDTAAPTQSPPKDNAEPNQSGNESEDDGDGGIDS